MPAHSFSGNIAPKSFFLDRNVAAKTVVVDKWRLQSRVVFCTASAVASWTIFFYFVRLLIG